MFDGMLFYFHYKYIKKRFPFSSRFKPTTLPNGPAVSIEYTYKSNAISCIYTCVGRHICIRTNKKCFSQNKKERKKCAPSHAIFLSGFPISIQNAY